MSCFKRLRSSLFAFACALLPVFALLAAGCASDTLRSLPSGYGTVVLAPVSVSGGGNALSPARTGDIAVAAGEAFAKGLLGRGYVVVVGDRAISEKILNDKGIVAEKGDTTARYAVLKGDTVSVVRGQIEKLSAERGTLKVFGQISITAPTGGGDDIFDNNRHGTRGGAVFNLYVRGNDGGSWSTVGGKGERQYIGVPSALEVETAALYAREVAESMPEARP